MIDVFAHGAVSAPLAASGGKGKSVQAIGPIDVSITADQEIEYVRSGDEVSGTLFAPSIVTVIEFDRTEKGKWDRGFLWPVIVGR